MSGKYTAGREAFGGGSLSWTADRIVAQLVGAGYRYNEGHGAESSLSAKIGAPAELSDKSIKRGYARCGQIVFERVSGNIQAAAIVIFRKPLPGNAQPDTLIVYLDGVNGFPITPNGGDILVDLPQEKGLFRL